MSRRVSALEDKEADRAYGAAAFGHRRRRGGDIMSQVSLPSHRHTRRLLGGHQGRRYNDDRDVERQADRDDDDDVHVRGGGGWGLVVNVPADGDLANLPYRTVRSTDRRLYVKDDRSTIERTHG